ncbi:MAG: hypothetical protein ACD_2C00005G0010 [uncultured bacterium (gcode 4)]|uniref:DUF4145 domain-containing protein n=1 Tax=uncultured bacterium (gcode 4) TaxID=1234023 RepID=K2H382_9BACT|nr:MAG: hypothetical protein ACD_2C00005G0010 [uncultured bacterium (gcode 4)]
MFVDWFIMIVAFAIILWISILIATSKKKSLNTKKKEFYLAKLTEIKRLEPSQRIIRYDSILSSILRDLGYTWTVWEQLKKKPFIIKDQIQTVWKLHKTRNRIAHEISEIKEASLEKEASQYESIIKNML